MKYNLKEYATLNEIDFLNELDILLKQQQISKNAYSSLKSRFYNILRDNQVEVSYENGRESYSI